MDTTTLFHNALWIFHPVVQTGIAAVMLRKGLYKKFKCFFAYIVTQILTFALIYPCYLKHNYDAYFYLYWVTHAIDALLGFLVIHEVFQDVFRMFHTLRDLGTVLFKWAGLVMLLVAGVVSISASSSDLVPWMQAIITTQRCVRIIQVGMVLFLLFFSRYLGASRREHSFGIALGFGFFAMVELASVAFWSGGHVNSGTLDVMNMTAYKASLLIWFGYVVLKSPAKDTGAVLLQSQRWEQSLTDLQHPVSADSLIPMFEDMVDRALLKTQKPVSMDVPIKDPQAVAVAASGSGGISLDRVNTVVLPPRSSETKK